MSGRGEWWATPAALLVVLAAVAWFEAPFLSDRAIVVERDALSSILPIRSFLAHALRQGSWPMWNPAPVLGKPFLPEWQTGLFYAPSALLVVTPFSRGFNLFFVFHYAWTALGAFLLLRALGTSRPGASLGAMVWALGGPLVSLGHLLNHLMAIAWLPWVLWGWVRTEDIRKKVFSSSLLLAVSLLTGSPEMALLIAALLVILAHDVRVLWVPPLAALLAAMQLLPVWLYLGLTHRGVHGLPVADVLAFSTPIARVTEFVYAGGTTSSAFLPSLYLGPIPVVLALGALAAARSLSRLLSILLVVGLLGIAFGSNAGLLPFLHAHLPGLDLLRYPEKLLLGVHAMIALGAAWGLTELGTRTSRPFAAAAAVVLVALTAADLARVNRGVLFTLPPKEVLARPEIARSMTASAGSGPGLVRYYANSTGAPTPHTPGEAVRLDRELLYAATGELYGLANVNTPASLNVIEHERLHRSLEGLPQAKALDTLQALGTGWVTSFVEMRSDALYPLPLNSNPAKLYRLRNTAERAFVAEQVLVAKSPEEALDRFVRSPEHHGLAVVEGIGVQKIAYRAPAQREVRLVEQGNDLLRIEVALDAPGLLVVNDSFLPGWRASVGGQATAIERVNGLVRGVWLGRGRHRVMMRYRAPGLPLGCALSLATLVGLVLLTWSPSSRSWLSYREGR